jgi:hypothetical protein
MIAGARCTNMTTTFTAGQLVNSSFSFEGIGYYYNPITIDSDDIYIDWTDDDGTAAAAITAQVYKSPHEVASALQTAMNAQTTETITVTYDDSTGKYTIATSTSATFSLLWNTGTNTANTIGDAIGFSVAADDTGATTYTSDSAQDYSAAYTPSYDGQNPYVAKSNEFFISDGTESSVTCFPASEVVQTFDLAKTDILSICATSGKSGTIPTSRTVTVTASALLAQYDADKWDKYLNNTTVRIGYNFGTKSGGNWVAGKCGCIYMPTAVITDHSISDNDGLIQLDLEMQCFVDSNGNGEVYLNLL